MTTEYKVLLVDDNQNVLHLLKYALEEQGVTVDCTTSPTDAMQMSMHHSYDAVIVSGDVALRRKLQGMRIPVLLTGRVGVEQLLAAIRSVAQYVIA